MEPIVTAVRAARNVASGVFLNQPGHAATNPSVTYAADLAVLLVAAIAFDVVGRNDATSQAPLP